MVKGKSLFVILLIALTVVLAALSGLIFKSSGPVSQGAEKPKASSVAPPSNLSERPHLSARARAGQELKGTAEIQNQIQLLTYLLDQGQEEEFLIRLQKEIETSPEVVEYRALLADFYYLKENWAGAETALNEVLKLAPDNSYAQTTLGEIIGIQGRYSEGLDLMNRVLDRDPTNLEALYGSLSIADLQGSPEVGVQKVTELYLANPKSGNLAVVYADVLLSQGRRGERKDVLARAMKADPQNPAPYRMAAMDAFRAGHHDSAIALAEEAITLDSNADTKSQTIEVLFDSAVAKGDFKRADAAILAGLGLQPWNDAWAVRRQHLDELRAAKN